MATTSLFDESGDISQKPVGGPGGGGSSVVGVTDPLVMMANKWVLQNEAKVRAFCEDAKECYRFNAGKQMSDQDEEVLKNEQRPNTAFNTAQKFVRYVSGVQRDSPTALIFNALDFDNTKAQLFSDRLTRYYDWAADKSSATLKRARAFEDFLLTGMGWCNVSISRARDPRGLIGYERISPLEMLYPDWDRVNLEDARWLARETFVSKEEAKALFPGSDYAQSLIDLSDENSMPVTTWPVVDKVPYIIPYVQTYPLDRIGGNQKKRGEKVKLMEMQWWANKTGYLFEDPLDNTEQFMSEDEFAEYRKTLRDLFELEIKNYDPQIGREYKRMFILNRRWLLAKPDVLPGQRFTYNVMCCHWDEYKRRWYGFFRVLMDPQRYANKFFNQMIEIVAKSAKGGYFVQSDAFEDAAQERDFIETASMTGAVNVLGDISKVKPKELPQVPAAAMAILDFCVKSMETVTGLSGDSLGLGASTAAGVTLKRRQRAGMVLLAAEFDAESEFRKQEGHLFLDHLKLIADDRLIRVGGPGRFPGEITQLEDAPFSTEYEIELDDVERDPNMKQWLADLVMGPFGQTLLRMNKFLPEFLNVLPIPRSWIESMKQAWMADMQAQQKAAAMGLPPPGGRGAKVSLPELQAKVRNKDADTALKMARAKALGGKQQQDQLRLILESLRDSMEETRQRRQAGFDQAQQALDIIQQIRSGGRPAGRRIFSEELPEG